jgi:hypothetical protein
MSMDGGSSLRATLATGNSAFASLRLYDSDMKRLRPLGPPPLTPPPMVTLPKRISIRGEGWGQFV